MMILSVATTVLVTQQPSVVVKGVQPDIIQSMAQEGNVPFHRFNFCQAPRSTSIYISDPRLPWLARGVTGAPGACLLRTQNTQGPGPVTAPPLCLGGNARGRQRENVSFILVDYFFATRPPPPCALQKSFLKVNPLKRVNAGPQIGHGHGQKCARWAFFHALIECPYKDRNNIGLRMLSWRRGVNEHK